MALREILLNNHGRQYLAVRIYKGLVTVGHICLLVKHRRLGLIEVALRKKQQESVNNGCWLKMKIHTNSLQGIELGPLI